MSSNTARGGKTTTDRTAAPARCLSFSPPDGASERHDRQDFLAPACRVRCAVKRNCARQAGFASSGRVHLDHAITGVELFLRLHHLASASEPAAETALNRVMDTMIKTPSSQTGSTPVSMDPKTNGSMPTNTPLVDPLAQTRESGNSSNLRRPSETPSTVKKTAPQRKPGYPPTAAHISSMAPSESTIRPISRPIGAHVTGPGQAHQDRASRGCISATSP